MGLTQPGSELRREFHGGEKDVGVLPSRVGGGLLQGRVWRGGRRLEGQRGPPEQPDSWCLWSRDMREKVREHVLHWYFLTSECVWRCARRLERSAKARLQWGQEKGFSPGEREQGVGENAESLGTTTVIYRSLLPSDPRPLKESHDLENPGYIQWELCRIPPCDLQVSRLASEPPFAPL